MRMDSPPIYNMYYEQQVPRRAGAKGRISGLMIATGVHQAKEGIEKHGRPFLERHPVIFSGIAGGFPVVPNKSKIRSVRNGCP